MHDNYKHTEITGKIIKAAYVVHDELGFGFLEKVYERAMAITLRRLGCHVEYQKAIPVYFDDELVGDYRADLIVNNSVIVELKAASALHPNHEVQLVNYLRATDIEVGLLVNFGEKLHYKRKVFSNHKKKTILPL